jgi:undecaprenyl-diphosphatase
LEQILHWDHDLFFQINNGWQNPLFDLIVGNATLLGDNFVLAVIVVPLLYFSDKSHFYRNVLFIISAVALSGILGWMLKHSINRPRPLKEFSNLLETHRVYIHVIFGPKREFSMPSGHTLTIFSAATVLSFLFKRFTALFFFFAVLTGLSRVYVGAHFPSDVIAGAFIGIVSSSIVYFFYFKKQIKKDQFQLPDL